MNGIGLRKVRTTSRSKYYSLYSGGTDYEVRHSKALGWDCTCPVGSVFRYRKAGVRERPDGTKNVVGDPGWPCKHVKFCMRLRGDNDVEEPKGEPSEPPPEVTR